VFDETAMPTLKRLFVGGVKAIVFLLAVLTLVILSAAFDSDPANT